MVKNHRLYQIALVEFDDNGKRQEGKKQLEAAVGLIRKARGLNPATGKVQPGTVGGMTILYIHCWKNKAQSVDGRRKDVKEPVEKFRESVKRISVEVRGEARRFRWRGKSVSINNSLLNWWPPRPRYIAAGRVGSDELQRTIAPVLSCCGWKAGRFRKWTVPMSRCTSGADCHPISGTCFSRSRKRKTAI